MSNADNFDADATGRSDPPPRFPQLKAADFFVMRFKRTRRLMVAGQPQPLDEAAVIEVTTDADWPAMGTGLALFVDGQPLLESERLAPKRYRFIAPAGVALKGGAPLALGLAGSGVPKPLSASKLKLPPLDQAAVRPE